MNLTDGIFSHIFYRYCGNIVNSFGHDNRAVKIRYRSSLNVNPLKLPQN